MSGDDVYYVNGCVWPCKRYTFLERVLNNDNLVKKTSQVQLKYQ